MSGSGRVDLPKTKGKAKVSQAIEETNVPQNQNINAVNKPWFLNHSRTDLVNPSKSGKTSDPQAAKKIIDQSEETNRLNSNTMR